MNFLKGILILMLIILMFVIIASIITITVAVLSLVGVIICVLLKRDSWKHKGEELYDDY